MNRMRGAAWFLLVLVAWPPPQSAAGDVGSAVRFGRNELLVSGTDAMHRGQFEEGISLILRGLKGNVPKHQRAEAYSNLCAGYNVTGQFDKALSYCDRSLSLNDGNWRAYHNRAYALLAQSRIDEAIEDASAGLALAPDERLLNDLLSKARRRRAKPHVVIEAFP